MRSNRLLLILIILFVLSSTLCFAIQNPAAKFCVEQGNIYKIKTDSGGNKYGVCISNKGEENDEWDFYKNNKDKISKKILKNSSLNMATTKKDLDNHLFQKKEKNKSPKISSLTLSGIYPSNFDWKDYDSKNWVTPIKNQGTCGSCWAFSAIGVVESKINIALNNPTYNIDLSEQDLVSCSDAGNCVDGGYENLALEHIKNEGVVKESCFLYGATDEPCSNKCSNWDNELVKIGYSGPISANVDAIKQAIVDYGPITGYMWVCDDFLFYVGGIYTALWEGECGWHTIDIVGYNDDNQYWIAKNSWGTGWGEDGYFRIAYSESIYNFEAWLIDPNDFRVFFLDNSYVVTSTDIDNDGIDDSTDNCPEVSNSDQINTDEDEYGDVCDLDNDNDGIDNDLDECPFTPGIEYYGGCPDTFPPDYSNWNYNETNFTFNDLIIEVDIADYNGISSAVLHYDYGDDDSEDGTVIMNNVEEDAYSATIPAAGKNYRNQYVSFFVRAIDNKDEEANAGDSAKQQIYLLNSAPTIDSYNPESPQTIDESESIEFTHTSSDLDGDDLTYDWLLDDVQQSITQNWTYITDYFSSGSHILVLQVSDGMDIAIQNWIVNVNNINRKPIWGSVPENQIIEEDNSLSYDVDASDPDNEDIIYSVNDTDFNIDENGLITWTPIENWNGVKFIIITANDGIDEITSEISITVTPVNDAPVLDLINDVEVTEGGLVTINPTANDEEEDELSYSIEYDYDNIEFNQEGNGFSWQTTFDDAGIYVVTIVADDGNGGTDSQEVTITVLNDLDKDGIPDIDDLDKDNDGINDSEDPLTGDVTHVSTNIDELSLRIGNSTNLTQAFSGNQIVEFMESNESLVIFNFDFSESTLNLYKVIIEQQTTNDYGSILVNGITLTGNETKTLYIDNLNENISSVCIKDEEISSITEISDNCNQAGEFMIMCDGNSSNGYTCTDLGNKYEITGLKHSGVKEQEPCEESWTCTDWGDCSDGTQTRTCTDINSCGTEDNKPGESQGCSTGGSTGGEGGGGGGGSGGRKIKSVVPEPEPTPTPPAFDIPIPSPEYQTPEPEETEPVEEVKLGLFTRMWNGVKGFFINEGIITGAVVGVGDKKISLESAILLFIILIVGFFFLNKKTHMLSRIRKIKDRFKK